MVKRSNSYEAMVHKPVEGMGSRCARGRWTPIWNEKLQEALGETGCKRKLIGMRKGETGARDSSECCGLPWFSSLTRLTRSFRTKPWREQVASIILYLYSPLYLNTHPCLCACVYSRVYIYTLVCVGKAYVVRSLASRAY